ncbi:hypothetical protein VTO42DRAFT_4746 [Malbranchea cinnamomea]
MASNQQPNAAATLPHSILIVGGGVFGLSTALALTRRHSGRIILVESSPTIPNPHGSSVDASRIVRADYANQAYAALANDAIKQWRTTEWGREGRYTQNGLLMVASADNAAYMKQSYLNVKKIEGDAVQELPTKADVQRIIPEYGLEADVAGGYINWGSGWGDAEASVKFAKKKLDETGKVEFRTGDVKRLISVPERNSQRRKITGVELLDGSTVTADLVILATGAWTGRLVDLRGRASATGQVLAYISITDEEQEKLKDMPTVLNFSSGMFIIPPRNNLLKIARHAYGYRNPIQVPNPVPEQGGPRTIEVSIPENGVPIPPEGERACRKALREMLPAFADRPFVKTRVCWYTDTPKGDFIVSYHPSYTGLFLATGGSGHAYKFFPVIGDKVVDALEGRLDPELQKLWAWPETPVASPDGAVYTEDGSRSGAKGMTLREELAKTEISSPRSSKL